MLNINPESAQRAQHLRRPHGIPTSKRCGAATVELAIVATFLATLIVGMVECTRALQVKSMLSEAARRGCRIGILPGRADSDIKTYVTDDLSQQGLDVTKVTITIQVNGTTANASTAQAKDRIAVQVSIPASSVAWVPSWFVSGTTLISDSVVMMRQ
jgi:Flp pilus assembly protein TadG